MSYNKTDNMYGALSQGQEYSKSFSYITYFDTKQIELYVHFTSHKTEIW